MGDSRNVRHRECVSAQVRVGKGMKERKAGRGEALERQQGTGVGSKQVTRGEFAPSDDD